MEKKFLHRSGLVIETDFSNENPPVFRYRLSATMVGACSTPKTLCAIMQNPSEACVEFADRSVQVLERVVFEKDFEELRDIERLIIVNQFAFIQKRDFVGSREQIGPQNNAAIDKAIRQSKIILIAWGKNNMFVQRQNEILEMIRCHEGKRILQTSRHPSKVIYSGFIQELST